MAPQIARTARADLVPDICPPFLYFASQELGIAAVIEEELQVFGVEAKLREAPANIVRCRTGRGSAGPAVASAGVFELDMASVCKAKSGMSERGIRHIFDRISPGVIGAFHRSKGNQIPTRVVRDI